MADSIDRQTAIDAIELTTWYHQNRNGEMVEGANSQEHQAWYKAEDVYNVLNDLPSAEPELPSAQPEQKWIPCSERLPEDEVEVLITDDAGGVQWLNIDRMLSYEDGSGRFWMASQNPIAWMPLPEPYRGEAERRTDG